MRMDFQGVVLALLALQAPHQQETGAPWLEYAFRVEREIKAQLSITPPSLMHGIGWLPNAAKAEPVALSPATATSVARQGSEKALAALWRSAVADALTVGQLKDLVLLEGARNAASFWAVRTPPGDTAITKDGARRRRNGLAWLLHQNWARTKTFRGLACKVRFEAEARSLRTPLPLVRAVRQRGLLRDFGPTSEMVCASALATPAATEEELSWARKVAEASMGNTERRRRAHMILLQTTEAMFTLRPSVAHQAAFLARADAWLDEYGNDRHIDVDFWRLRRRDVAEWVPKR